MIPNLSTRIVSKSLGDIAILDGNNTWGISADQYILVTIFIGVVLIVGVFVKDRRNRKKRNTYFDRYPASDLRMSPYKIGVVYRVVGLRDGEIIAVRIWDAGRPVYSDLEISLLEDELIPFDRSRFT